MKDQTASDKMEYVLRYGKHVIDPDVAAAMFTPTDAEPGSREKIEIMAQRFALGMPLFHEKDRSDYIGAGLLAAVGKKVK